MGGHWAGLGLGLGLGGQSYIVNTSHGYFRKDNLDIWRNNMRKAKSTQRKASNAKSSNGYGSE